jgi:hypothetical protein
MPATQKQPGCCAAPQLLDQEGSETCSICLFDSKNSDWLVLFLLSSLHTYLPPNTAPFSPLSHSFSAK